MSKSNITALPAVENPLGERSEAVAPIYRLWVLAPFLGLVALASLALVIAAASEVHSYPIALSVPVGFLLMLWVALRRSWTKKPVDRLLAEPPPQTPWRLLDPHLSHWGVWRAELGRLPVDVAGCGDDRQIKAYLHKLADDWSIRSARGGRVVRISRPVSPVLSPFGDGPKGCKVYRVTLDDWSRHPASPLRRTGWLRLGTGWAEFQLSRHPAEPTAPLEVLDAVPPPLNGERPLADVIRNVFGQDEEPSQSIGEQPPLGNPLLGQHHPMWDRWIDL